MTTKFADLPYNRPDIETLKTLIENKIKAFKTTQDFEEQVALILEIEEIQKQFYNTRSIGMVRHHQNIKDPFYDKEIAYFNKSIPLLANALNAFNKAVLASPHQTALGERFGNYYLTRLKIDIESHSPIVDAEQIEINELTTAHFKRVAQVTCIWEGKEGTISQLYKHFDDPDRAIRKKVRNLYSKTVNEKIYPEASKTFHQLTKIRFRMAEKLGFEKPIELFYKHLGRVDYTPEDVAQFRKHLRKRLIPIQEKMIERKKELFQITDFQYYDSMIQFLDGPPHLQIPKEAFVETTAQMYKELSPETDAFFQMMQNRQFFDLDARLNKAQSNYAVLLPLASTSFIFGNCYGTFRDLSFFTHEVGHAFQKHLTAQNHQEILADFNAGKETAEIHSTAMEYFCWDWYDRFLGENTNKYKYLKLSEVVPNLLNFCRVDHFQEAIYADPNQTIAQRNEVFKQINTHYFPFQTDAYFDHNPFYTEGRTWITIPHIYSMPFYFIDYAIATVCALQFWQKSRINFDAAWQDYIKLCKIGGSLPFKAAIAEANLNSPFEAETIDAVMDLVENMLEELLLPEMV